ncbi:MAG: nitroreductase [Pseudomonadota bacterium]
MRGRRSVRAFTSTAVKPDLLRDVLRTACWAPSGGNLQPWRIDVVVGAARDGLVATVKAAIAANPFANEAEIDIYPKDLWTPYRERRYAVGEALYQSIDIPREDKAARLTQLARNFDFFDAPVGLFFSLDRRFDKGQWAHLGMVMQSIALAAHERDLATCMQEAWATRARTVSDYLCLPDRHQLYCGMALGYEDKSAPINQWRAARAPLDDLVVFHEHESSET